MLQSIRILYRPSWNHRTKFLQDIKKRFVSTSRQQGNHHHPQRSGGSSSVVVTGVFPDDSASAAGVRTRFLLERLGELAAQKTCGSVILTTTDKDWAHQLPISSSSQRELNEQKHQQQWIPHLKVEHLPMNRSEAVDSFLSKHQGIERIIFDRFYVEEAYSHSFWEASNNSNTAMILDMQDMHSLRHGRQELVRRMDHTSRNDADPLAVIPAVMDYLPSVNGNGKDSDRLLRELASIHRCDLTLVCSPYEMDLLEREYGVPKDKLCLASFFVNPTSILETNLREQGKVPNNGDDDEETKFIFCGGFLHDPNVDAAHVLLKHIWPRLQKMVPSTSKRKISLHIHGAYCPESILQSHNPRNGIYVHGYTPRLEDIFDNQTGRNILLAPLRFGAGIKGKILDAWTNGMPVVTTPVGSEGIVDQNDHQNDHFGGAVCSTVQDFCENAIALMMDNNSGVGSCYYSKAQKNGFQLLQKEFHAENNWNTVQQHLQALDHSLGDRRQRDPTQAMLWHQSLKSTKYFSKWIEEKETKRTKDT